MKHVNFYCRGLRQWGTAQGPTSILRSLCDRPQNCAAGRSHSSLCSPVQFDVFDISSLRAEDFDVARSSSWRAASFPSLQYCILVLSIPVYQLSNFLSQFSECSVHGPTPFCNQTWSELNAAGKTVSPSESGS